MSRVLRVGIIGASAERGWAKISHVPAVQKVAGLELTAVASGSQEKAEAAAKAFGAKAAYGNGMDLVHDPNVDILTVAVKVPDHRALVLGAVAAGKHVYCEWPLGSNLSQTEEMAEAARLAGVRTAVGLQLRSSREAKRARELVSSGAIGRVLSARIVSTTAAFGPKVEVAMAFAEKEENGATLTTIQGAHTFDLAIFVLGGFTDVAALATTQYPRVDVEGEAEAQVRSTADHVIVQSRLATGAALSIEVAGGRPPNWPFIMEVMGTTGIVSLEGGAARGVQTGRLRLLVNGEPFPVDESAMGELPETAASVAGIYEMLRDDILSGTSTAPDFGHAARLARLTADVSSSSQAGIRKAAAGWPEG